MFPLSEHHIRYSPVKHSPARQIIKREVLPFDQFQEFTLDVHTKLVEVMGKQRHLNSLNFEMNADYITDSAEVQRHNIPCQYAKVYNKWVKMTLLNSDVFSNNIYIKIPKWPWKWRSKTSTIWKNNRCHHVSCRRANPKRMPEISSDELKQRQNSKNYWRKWKSTNAVRIFGWSSTSDVPGIGPKMSLWSNCRNSELPKV